MENSSRSCHERQPEEQTVVGDVERDPDEDDHRGGAAGFFDTSSRIELGSPPEPRACPDRRAAGDPVKHVCGFPLTALPDEVVRALRECQPSDEGEEGRKGGREEQVAPTGRRSPGRGTPRRGRSPAGAQRARRSRKTSAAPLRRQVLREHREDRRRACRRARCRRETGTLTATWPPRERGERRETRVPEDRSLEDVPAADAIGQSAEDDAAEEGPPSAEAAIHPA